MGEPVFNFAVRSLEAGVRTKPALDPLVPVLRSWTELNDRYCRDHPHDAPYWHAETTNVGMLGAAACCAGLISLAEYPSAKKGWSGRTDLYISEVGGGDGFHAAFEAKQVYPILDGKQDALEIVQQGLDDACSDAKYSDKFTKTKIGVVFASIKLAPTLAVPDIDWQIRAFLRSLKVLDFDAIAWSFPASHRRLRAKERNGLKRPYIWPGAVLLMRKCA